MDGGGGRTQRGCAHCHWSAKVARRGPCAAAAAAAADGTQTPGSWGSWEVAEGPPSLALGCGGSLTEDDGGAVATVRRQRAPSPHAPAGYCGLSGPGFAGEGGGNLPEPWGVRQPRALPHWCTRETLTHWDGSRMAPVTALPLEKRSRWGQTNFSKPV